MHNPNPTHPGKIFRKIYKNLGWKQKELIQEIGCSSRTVNETVNCKRGISPNFAVELENSIGVDAEMWVRLQAEYDLYVARQDHQ